MHYYESEDSKDVDILDSIDSISQLIGTKVGKRKSSKRKNIWKGINNISSDTSTHIGNSYDKIDYML